MLSVFQVNAKHLTGCQVYPSKGEELCAEEVERLLNETKITAKPCGPGKIKLSHRAQKNISLKLPVIDMHQQIAVHVPIWFPGEEVILLVE